MWADFEAMSESRELNAELTRQEFEEPVRSMKKGKTQGVDGIPSEVWSNSLGRSQNNTFWIPGKHRNFLWHKEDVPENLSLCRFIMLYKNKGSKDDYTKYRVIGILNYTYNLKSCLQSCYVGSSRNAQHSLASDRLDSDHTGDAETISCF